MLKQLFLLVFYFGVPAGVVAQDGEQLTFFDDKYLEDQFYVGLGYNFLLNKPTNEVVQRNLSYNIQLGLIKDIPFNKQRNFGLGLGVGYATNSYYTNLLALKQDNVVSYRLALPAENFSRSKIETHAIEIPLELRWRTSNPLDYKFWRVYAGLKFAYLFSRKSKLRADDLAVFTGQTNFNNDDVGQLQYGLMLNFGYNTWNLHLYYALSEFMDKSASFNGQSLGYTPFRVGVIFYVL